MVGLKAFWILAFTLLFASCVPMTKQSECGANQAFDPSSRTCISTGSQSGVYIPGGTPTGGINKTKLDTTPITLTINQPLGVAGKPYAIVWEHSHLSGTTSIGSCGSYSPAPNPLECVFHSPSNLQTGFHTVTAKVVVNSSTAATYTFNITINDNPKVHIVESTIKPSPTQYLIPVFKDAPARPEFSFKLKNNQGINTSAWQVKWSLNGPNSSLTTYTNMLSLSGSGDENLVRFGNLPLHDGFDHLAFPVGTYQLMAQVIEGTSVIITKNWTIVLQHPDWGVVSSATSPLPSVQTTAFFDTSFGVYGFFNTSSPSTPSNFCVQVSNPDGSYAGDSKGIEVRYYNDVPNSTPIFIGKTSPGNDEICFTDAPPANQALLKFSNGSPTIPHVKRLIARVFDEASGSEICLPTTLTNGCPGVSYPIEWPIEVKPKNTPAAVGIYSAVGGDNISYTTPPNGTATTALATVTQDQTFKIRFKIADDPLEYDPYLAVNKFKFTALLERSSVVTVVSGCQKDYADPYPVGTTVAGIKTVQVVCDVTIPSSDASGHIAPGPQILRVQVSDADSPVPTSGSTNSTLMVWSLDVKEAQTAPVINSVNVLVGGAVPAVYTENDTLTFRVTVTDAEKHNYNLVISKCSDASCSTPVQIGTTSVTYGGGATSVNQDITYTIPQNAIGNVLAADLHFQVRVADIPNTVPSMVATQVVTLPNVENFNPAPVITNGSIIPAVNTNLTPYYVFSGNKFSISANLAVTDASAAGSGEEHISYKWWISDAVTTSWTEIQGATGATLRWTPGPELTTLQKIRFCATDDRVPTPLPDPSTGGICSQDIFVQPYSNLYKLTEAGAKHGKVAIHTVPSEKTVYVAYSYNNGTSLAVGIEKFVYTDDGELLPSGMAPIHFSAGAGTVTPTVLSKLSLTSSPDALFVAYLADDGVGERARIRKINISNPAGQEKTAFPLSTRKFDFSYLPINVTTSCTVSPTACVYDSVNRTLTFDGSALASTDKITISFPGRGPGTEVEIGVYVGTPVSGQICGNCTADVQALTFAQAVNNHASVNIQGLSIEAIPPVPPSTPGSPTVTFHGSEGIYYDFVSDDPSIQPNSDIGKIVYNPTTNHWYLPVIGTGLVGPEQNKVIILSSDANADFTTITKTKLTGLENVTFLDNTLYYNASAPATSFMGLSYVTTSGESFVAKLPLTGSVYSETGHTKRQIFPGKNMAETKIHVAASSPLNPNFFITSKDSSGVYYLARIPTALNSDGDQVLPEDIADAGHSYNVDILTNSAIRDIVAVPALVQGTESSTDGARVLVVADYGGQRNSFLFKWSKDGVGVNTLALAGGVALESTGDVVDTTSEISVAPTQIMTLGSAGYSLTENTRNTLPFVRVVTSTGPVTKVEAGFLNTQVETIDSTTRAGTGEYRPALVK